jgi:membrane protein DedA with SNARE-associated domain
MDELGLGLLVGAGLLFVKETGVPIPVPGDLIVLGLGVAAAQGAGNPLLIALLVVAATIAGGAIQFLVLGGPGRRLLLGLSRRAGLGEERIERHAARLRGGGARAVAITRMTPGLRIVAIAGAAFAALPFIRFLAGLAVGNGVFVGGHFAAGFLVGPAASGMLSAIGLGVVAIVVAVAGLIAWRLLLGRRGASAAGQPEEGVAAWTDASCPACLAVGVVAARLVPESVRATPAP